MRKQTVSLILTLPPTADLYFQSPVSYDHASSQTKNIKVIGQLVKKLQQKQMAKQTRLITLPSPVPTNRSEKQMDGARFNVPLDTK